MKFNFYVEISPTNLSKDKDGKILSSANDVVQAWTDLLVD